jgi:hypothetical protein
MKKTLLKRQCGTKSGIENDDIIFLVERKSAKLKQVKRPYSLKT